MGVKYISNGKPIRILCTDRPNADYPVVGMCNGGFIMYFTEEGKGSYGEEYNLVEVWEPQEGEWCWFWDNSSRHPVTHLRVYSGKTDNFFRSADGCAWENCGKFTGELPEHLKDK